MKQSYVYILKCSDQSYYTGVTSNLEQRILRHETGFYPGCYTYNKRPVTLVFHCEFTDINEAIAREKQIKKWSRAKKEALINGNYDDLVLLAASRQAVTLSPEPAVSRQAVTLSAVEGDMTASP